MDYTKAQRVTLYRKGYRFQINFNPASRIPALATKTLQQMTELMRTTYKEQKNWWASEFNEAGELIGVVP